MENRIIASTYQVIREIGSGGGGVVYLATHLRLGKFVVLKADKRGLTQKPEALRREVDALKNLSHTYIPQVYDFIEENGVVYTVMDYVEGESLDKPLKRGSAFPQATVVQWACQLLEALNYMHTRPPHGILHGDIKPANIMLTPQGDIRLIDFNIALALGEKGAVRVGFSQGYASPEHYGIDYAGIAQTQRMAGVETVVTAQAETMVTGNVTFVPPTDGGHKSSRSAEASPSTLLDVRSDIYSLGATLYHLLTGVRPAREAAKVIPISDFNISPAVAAIIEKAMQPCPDDRYQTAAEMLDAFEHLYENDPRTLHYKKAVRITIIFLCTLFLTGGALTLWGLRQTAQEKSALVLAQNSVEAYRQGDTDGALAYALQAIDKPYTPQAQRALTQALGVYDLADHYKPHKLLTMPSEPSKIRLSDDGEYLAVLLTGEIHLYNTEDGSLHKTLTAYPSAHSDMAFCGTTLYYAGSDGLTAYSITKDRQLWVGEAATALTCSADGSTVAAIFKDEPLIRIYDAAQGTLLRESETDGLCQTTLANDTFADSEDDLLVLSGDGHWLAVSFSNGALRLFDLQTDTFVEVFEVSSYTHFEGGFCGEYFACGATGSGKSELQVINATTGQCNYSFTSSSPLHVFADSTGIFASNDNVAVSLNPEDGTQKEAAFMAADILTIAGGDGVLLVSSDDKNCGIFDVSANCLANVRSDEVMDRLALGGKFAALASRSSPFLRLLKHETHPEAQLFTYDADFVHDEARVSSDKSTVMLFRYDAFRLYSADGKVLCEAELPDAANVYDQQYLRDADGCYLEVTWYDGTVRKYSAVDGRCIDERHITPPNTLLTEEFTTDTLRVESPLHGTPVVYDMKSGKELYLLESDDYLTYVTQVEDQLLTEYTTAQGERYGLLLDSSGSVIADIPELCDILPDGTLVFDDMRGNLRRSRIYSMQELLALAKN